MKSRSDSAPRTVMGQTAADAEKDARIARLTADRDAAILAKDCFQRMTRAHWEALCAMRNSINEFIPMPNTDSGPLFSPEDGPIYANIAERVIADLTESRAYALALEQELRDRAEKAEAERDAALAGAVKVKPIIFNKRGVEWWGSSAFGIYVVSEVDTDAERMWAFWQPDANEDNVDAASGFYSDERSALTEAQADHEARIRAALQPDPDARQADLSAAARDVLAERARQISVEGWTPEHDDQHVDGEMAQASGCYALNAAGWKTEALRGCWPIKWMAAWFKPTDPRRDLVKAGALCIAEIERLDRALTPPADLAAKIGGAE